MRVERVGAVEEVNSVLLGDCSQDELLLVGVGEEKVVSKEGKVDLSRFGRVVENSIDKNSRRDPLQHSALLH